MNASSTQVVISGIKTSLKTLIKVTLEHLRNSTLALDQNHRIGSITAVTMTETEQLTDQNQLHQLYKILTQPKNGNSKK